MDDVDFSQHKLLKNDMEAVTELKKEPYDDFSLDKWNLDSDLAKSNLPRLVSLLVGGAPLVHDTYVPVYNAFSGQTETMEAKWANLKKMEEEGVEILTCGTCLKHYGLMEKLMVGKVTDMYTIAERMTGADKVIRP